MNRQFFWVLLSLFSIFLYSGSLQALPYTIVYLGNGAQHEGLFALRLEDDLRREFALIPKTMLRAPEECQRTAQALDFSREPRVSEELISYCQSHFPESTLVAFTNASPVQLSVKRRLLAFSSQVVHATVHLTVLSMLQKKVILSTEIDVSASVDGPFIGLTFPSELRVPAIEQSRLITMLSREASLRAAHFIDLIARASDSVELAHLRANAPSDTVAKKAADVDSVKSQKK